MNYANIFAKMFPEREIDDQFTHHLSRCSLRMDNLRQYALAMNQVCRIPILAVPLP